MFPDSATCKGEDKSPPFTWTAGPANTQSYALVLFDQDASNGSGLFHWAIWDIPATVTSLPAELPAGTSISSPVMAKQVSFKMGGMAGAYAGPCPMGMLHTYKFTVYALDVATLPGELNSAMAVDAAAKEHDLASATLSAKSNASRAQ